MLNYHMCSHELQLQYLHSHGFLWIQETDNSSELAFLVFCSNKICAVVGSFEFGDTITISVSVSTIRAIQETCTRTVVAIKTEIASFGTVFSYPTIRTPRITLPSQVITCCVVFTMSCTSLRAILTIPTVFTFLIAVIPTPSGPTFKARSLNYMALPFTTGCWAWFVTVTSKNV